MRNGGGMVRGVHEVGARWGRLVSLLLTALLIMSVFAPPGGVVPTSAAPLVGDEAAEDIAALEALDEEETLELAALSGGRAKVSGGMIGVELDTDGGFTDEEIRTAIPMRPPALEALPVRAAAAGPGPDGPPGFIPARQPDGRPVEAAALGESDADRVGVHRIFEVPGGANLRRLPFRAVGQLTVSYSSVPGAPAFACTAASIGGDAIWTAAHCLHEGGGGRWIKRAVFTPGSAFFGQTAQYPLGKWDLTYAVAPLGFINSKNAGVRATWDYGGGLVKRDSRGSALSSVAGTLGLAWNQPYTRSYLALGYPGTRGGKTLWACSSPVSYVLPIIIAPPVTLPLIGLTCGDLGKGMSGGPWLMGGTSNVIGGNGAAFITNTRLFSPYYNENTSSYFKELRTKRSR